MSIHLSIQVRACILYVEQSTRLLGLSLRNYLLQPETRIDPAPAGGERIGEVVKDCKMITVHHMSGAILEFPDKTMAFAHVSQGSGLTLLKLINQLNLI